LISASRCTPQKIAPHLCGLFIKRSRPTWGQVNVQNYDETKDSTEQVDIDDESATEGYNVASIMSYATVDDTNKYTDETLEKENDVDAEEVTRTSF